MSQVTKRALEASLKKLLLEKPCIRSLSATSPMTAASTA